MKVKAIKNFEWSSVRLFQAGKEYNVSKYMDRYFYLPKNSHHKVLIPKGILVEIKDKDTT